MIGLGYVGLPVAVAFGQNVPVIGFDINSQRIAELTSGSDHTHAVTREELQAAQIFYTCDAEKLARANFHIIAVPTPVDNANQPDFTPLELASETVGSILKRGDIVVYESTVYPGATEEICLPILEQVSGLVGGVDFTVGYSPERINPGDSERTFTKIQKVVAGQDAATLEVVAQMYGSVVAAGVHRAPTIRVAEAAKVIENTQRDLNIALMNELAIIFEKMDICTADVLEAAGTKWNFLKFTPGLVGGHCIGVDPYYLTFKAEQLGYIPQVILAGRQINDGMSKFIAQMAIKKMIHAGQSIRGARALILGVTFKENCPDTRNSKVIDMIKELKSYGVECDVCDPRANPTQLTHEYNLQLSSWESIASRQYSLVIGAVAHDEFKNISVAQFKELQTSDSVLVDVKGMFKQQEQESAPGQYWKL